jgi:hypothetical protein
MNRNTSRARWSGKPSDWSLFELAIFDQARRSFEFHGLHIEYESGITENGEPWLAFCDSNANVFGHFARLGDRYIACVPFHDHGSSGDVLSELLDGFLQRLTTRARITVLEKACPANDVRLQACMKGKVVFPSSQKWKWLILTLGLTLPFTIAALNIEKMYSFSIDGDTSICGACLVSRGD